MPKEAKMTERKNPVTVTKWDQDGISIEKVRSGSRVQSVKTLPLMVEVPANREFPGKMERRSK